jgi:hypothetical protein
MVNTLLPKPPLPALDVPSERIGDPFRCARRLPHLIASNNTAHHVVFQVSLLMNLSNHTSKVVCKWSNALFFTSFLAACIVVPKCGRDGGSTSELDRVVFIGFRITVSYRYPMGEDEDE